MGESSACLVRSLSQPSPTSQDSKEGDPIRRALTSSISFGRFMSEPLVWEKWSAFTHDRYLEDAKKYSRPGSVAEKKAYFEAHFKRIVAMKATGSLDPQNITVNNHSESNEMDEIDEEHPVEKQQEGSHVATAEDQGEKHATAAFATGNASLEKREAASVYIEETTGGLEEPDFLEKHIESSFHFKDVQGISVSQEVMTPVEDAITMGVSASLDKKIPRPPPLKSTAHTIGVSTSMDKKIPRPPPLKSTAHTIGVSTSLDKKIPRPSPSKSTVHTVGVSTSLDKKIPRPFPSKSTVHTIGVSTSLDKKIPRPSPSKSTSHAQVSTIKPTVKRGTPIRSKIADQATAFSKKITEIWDKSRTTPKSLHMSINFSSHSTDVKKTSSPLLHKIANSKFVTNLKTAKESTSQHTLTKASTDTFSKHLSAAPQPDNRRTKSLLRQSVAEMVTGERNPKTSLMPSQSSTTHVLKEHPPIVCPLFTLKSEERAAKRKEFFQKLKEKREAEEAENKSQSSTTHVMKERSPIVCPPFSLKSEERAAKRKEFFEKLKEKREADEAEKEKLQGKLKGKTRNDVKDRQPLTSQANTNRSIDLSTNLTKIPVKKISTSQPCSPMISRNQSTELCHNSRPSWRNSLKMDSIKDGSQKNDLPPAYSSKLLPKKSTRENAPPNIQH